MTDGAISAMAPHGVVAWSGVELLAALTSATNQLQAHVDLVNALNVFPVPDGDTGTNMNLTMRSALDETASLSATLRSHSGEVAKRIEFGSLMGARGNSGVILSQIFRGFAREIAATASIGGRDLARALDGARELAYKAVLEPVEGTMLTVIRVAAEHASEVPGDEPSLLEVASAALRGAEIALAQTPYLLDRLRKAGVVDAGGQGVVYLLDGIARYAMGDPVASGAAATNGATPALAALNLIDEMHGEDAYGYCTNFMIFGEGIPYEKVRADIAAMGQSAVVVGDDRVIKVHVHTEDPGTLLSYAVRYGELGQIKIDNMNSQVADLSARRETANATGSEERHAVALLAVASGSGLGQALRDSGATGLIEGGQTMNPSIEELLSAVESSRSDAVILLPNNPNILLAANRVPELATKRVVVVPSRSIPQGLAALQAYNPDAPIDSNVAKMGRAVTSLRTVEVTRADKDASFDGLSVRKGQFIGLVDDKLQSAGDDEIAVTLAALAEADAADAELITIFTGDGQTPDAEGHLTIALTEAFPGAEFEIYDGGQPHYRYVIAVE